MTTTPAPPSPPALWPAEDPRLVPLVEARARGWLGPLDLALARFLIELTPGAPASLVLAVGWLGRAVSLGHTALDLSLLARSGVQLLAWPDGTGAAWSQGQATVPATADAARETWSGVGPALAVVDLFEPADPSSVTAAWVLDGARLYLRRTWVAERRVASDLTRRAAERQASSCLDGAALAGSSASGPADAAGVLDAWLDRLFGAPDTPAGAEAADQRAACATAARAALTVVTGGPGTGKTFTAARLLVLLHALEPPGRILRVGLAAPTGKAAARLRQSLLSALEGADAPAGVGPELRARAASAPARTLHAWLGLRSDGGQPRHHRGHPLPLDLLLLDEASMVDLALMAALLDALPPQARLVLLGDPDQLASVEAGSVLGDLCHAAPGTPIAAQTVRLGRSRRFSGPIGDLAAALRRGDAEGARQAMSSGGDASGPVAACSLPAERASDPIGTAALAVALSADAACPGHGVWLSALTAAGSRPSDGDAVDAWVRVQLQRLDDFRVLCVLREGARGVSGWNAAIEHAAAERGWLAPRARRGEWYDGRPVMVTRNDPGLELFNGDIGLVLRVSSAGGLRAWFLQGSRLRSVAVGRLPPVETAFAMTVHKSQGSEFAHVLLVLPDQDQPALTRELLYTAITRARRRVTLAAHDLGVLGAGMARATSRMGGLGDRFGSFSGGAVPDVA